MSDARADWEAASRDAVAKVIPARYETGCSECFGTVTWLIMGQIMMPTYHECDDAKAK